MIRLEDLQCDDLKIFQDSELYTFTSDSCVLANFINLKKNDKALEIGAGCGVISILLTAKTHCHDFLAFEAQKPLFELCKKNIKINHLEDKVQLVCDKIQHFKNYLPAGSVDVVFSNPPYMLPSSSGENEVRYFSRHDELLNIKDLTGCASSLLKNGGHFYVVYSAERTAELLHQLINANLQPKRIFFTENGKGRVVLIVVDAVKGGKSGVRVLPNLITNDEEGNYLEKLHTKYIKMKD